MIETGIADSPAETAIGATGAAAAASQTRQAGASATLSESPDQGDSYEGKRLALELCTSCHIVGCDQEFPPNLHEPVPSFRVIANRPNISASSLRAFLAMTHSTVKAPANTPNPRLTDEQAAQLVSYILSLREQH
jgi:cytochrome c1